MKLDGRKHFRGSTQNNGAVLADMLNGDLIKLLRLKSMKRISHFVWLRKQFYQVRDLKCAEISFFSSSFFSFLFLLSCFSGYATWRNERGIYDSSLSGGRTIHGINVLSA